MNFFARLFYKGTLEPFDLTGVTEIAALFPGINGTPYEKTKTGGAISMMGAPGAGKIQVALSSVDTAAMLANPQIAQNLQFIVTISGVAQIDAISFGSPPNVGVIYEVTINGVAFSYQAKTGDTAEDVFDALSLLINAGGLLVSSVVSGSDNSAILTITSIVAGLGFTDAVNGNMILSNSTPNGGVRTIFLLQQVLNIQPQDYSGA